MFLFSEYILVQKKVKGLEGLQDVGGAFDENNTSELQNLKILK